MMPSFSRVSLGIIAAVLAVQSHAGLSASISVVNGQPGVAVAYHPDYGFGDYPTTTYVQRTAPQQVVETTTYGVPVYQSGYYASGYPSGYPSGTVTTTTTTYTHYPNTVIYQQPVVVVPAVQRPVVVQAANCNRYYYRCADYGYYRPTNRYVNYRTAPKKVVYRPVNVPHGR